MPRTFYPWRHVTVDIEGLSTPVANSGVPHVFEYLCMLTRGVIYELLRGLVHSKVRRACSRCFCRAGTLPQVIACDRGPEIWNLLFREMAALLHAQIKPGSPWRPVEQGAIEREHVEFRIVEGVGS